MAEAHHLHTGAEPLRRAELEPRLLGGDPDVTIAARMGLSPDAVGAYHDLYFDVRPYLNADSYRWEGPLEE